MAEKIEAFLVVYSSQERANSAPEFRNGALGGLSQERSHQAGAGGGLVDEHQSGGIKQALLANPAPPRPRHVRPFLLRRAQAFFDGDIMSLEKSPDRRATAWNSLLAHRHNDLVPCLIRLLLYQSQQPFS